jgi:hypothetical protein
LAIAFNVDVFVNVMGVIDPALELLLHEGPGLLHATPTYFVEAVVGVDPLVV